MKKERIALKASILLQNNGQIAWLPKNPRQWTQTDIDNTAASIREDEDFLEDRPCLVTPDGKKYVVFAGNLRLTGARKEGLTVLPCVVYYPETEQDRATIKRRALKDNGQYGSWDYDILANEWDDNPLGEWGVKVPDDWGKVPEPVAPVHAGSSTIPGAENLPPELQGLDINPDNLPKIQGSDETAMDRIIIVYPKDKAEAIAQTLGLEAFDKVVYPFAELPLLKPLAE